MKMLIQLPSVLSLVVGAFALPQLHTRANTSVVGDTKITWSTKCKTLAGESPLPMKCADFSVPLDYTKPNSTKTLDLTLVRFDAVRKPVKGSVLFNPGGPGGSGVQFVIGRAQQLMTVLGGQFNLIGFDPRGVNNTLPYVCDSDLYDGVPLLLSNASDVAIGQNFANAEIQAAQCLAATKDIGGLIGTAFVARDMARIVDALGEDGLLRYWGFSYGTVLGATFAAMFPEKVGKIVIDGNVNVHEYYSGWDVSTLASVDGTVAGFFSGCVTSELCALAGLNQTAEQLAQTVDDLLESLKTNPLPVTIKGHANNELLAPYEGTSMLIDYSTVKQVMFSQLYSPDAWPLLAEGLQFLLTGNLTGFFEVFTILTGGGEGGESDQALQGIEFGEQALRTDNLTTLDPLISAVTASSKWGGLDFGLVNAIQSVRWKQTAKEIYSGDWHVQTKHPILIIGNSYDPATPLISAQNTSASFEGSVVLQHNGYGHTSLAQPGLCSARAVQSYFVDGVLPAPGTVCEPDVALFSGETWEEDFAPLSLNGTAASITKRENDVTLLTALKQVGKSVHRINRRVR
ncbi:hypothetical protein G647_01187 [Cladophialophora carrionii CBS 160.54]|uniref:Uncharacterized protein n=1 Tax=Cladophialophora carrionii CBS 160.54 TaxID=1279043 RepID=V9DPZ4_9EURO|nr:uncharacterized protein G647_01187 [Cladophialophora carrionii CBS 160.54]ETI28736.1 hypothetical protein G647_01187 [Cladophialophora carrionii CBS 160.54]